MTRHQMMMVAAHAYADPRTVARWARGERVRGQAHDRIAAAAARLGVVPSYADGAEHHLDAAHSAAGGATHDPSATAA